MYKRYKRTNITMLIDILLLTIIIVYVIDLSGIITQIEWWLSKMLDVKCTIPKPFNCSFCLSWWIGLIYLIITSNFTLTMICYVAMLSFLTPIINDIIILLRDTLRKLIQLFYTNL